jgi:hypothetical protein
MQNILFNSLNTELNPVCHLLALSGAHPIFHVSRIRVKKIQWYLRLYIIIIFPPSDKTGGGGIFANNIGNTVNSRFFVFEGNGENERKMCENEKS